MNTKPAIILGCTGQDGSLLCKLLLEKGQKVVGLTRSNTDRIRNLKILGIEKDVEIKKGDITDFKTIEKLIHDYHPEAIYNLAAQSSVGKSIIYPLDTMQGIVNGSLNLLEVSRNLNYSGKIFFAGSSEIFGNTEKGADIEYKQSPISPYAIAKQASFNLVKLYREIHQIKCVTGILFNHESHLRNENFVTQKIIKNALSIKKNDKKRLRLGNINVVRDWGWAPEYVEAIELMTNSTHLNDHIICSGKKNSLKDFIEKVFLKFDLDWREYIEIDSELFRPNEIAQSYGNPDPIFNELGWRAKEDLDSIINKLINLYQSSKETKKVYES